MNTLDPTTWKGFLAEKTGGLDEKAVKDIQKKIKNGETIPSIVVMQWYGAEVLYDGHHRFEAHKREKKLCPYEYIYEGEFV